MRPAPTMEIPSFITVLGYRVSTFEHQFMHVSGLLFFTLIAIFWLAHGLRVAIGALQLPWLKDSSPAADADCPRVSLLVAARDEEGKLPEALVSRRLVDYPVVELSTINE